MKSLILLLCFFLCVQHSFCQKTKTTPKTTPHTSTPNKLSSTTPSPATTTATTSTTIKPNSTMSNSTTSNSTMSNSTASNSTTSNSTTSNSTTSNSSMSSAATSKSTATKITKAHDPSKVTTMLTTQLKNMSDQQILELYKELRGLVSKKGLLKHAPAKTAKVVSTTKPKASAKDTDQTPTHGTAKTKKATHAVVKPSTVSVDTKTVTGGTVSSTSTSSTKKDAKSKKEDKDDKDSNGIVPESMKNKTPDSSHFAVVFLVLIALLFGLYALYHNRGKIIAVVVEGRSGAGNRGGRDRYRKLDNNSEDPEARIKNSNEVYVY